MDPDPHALAVMQALVDAWTGFQMASRDLIASLLASSPDVPEPLPLFAAYNRVGDSLRSLRDAVDAASDQIGKVVFDGMQEIVVEAIAEEAKR